MSKQPEMNHIRSKTKASIRQYFFHYAMRFRQNQNDEEASFFLWRAWWKLSRSWEGGEANAEFHALAKEANLDYLALKVSEL